MSEWLSVDHSKSFLQNPSTLGKIWGKSIFIDIYEKLILWFTVPWISIFSNLGAISNLDVPMNIIKSIALILEF